jgi:D-serine deaminase-like pyridoxal phosphate-dependent protein
MSDIGQPVSALDTPALLIDLPAMERNIAAMARNLAGTGVQLRPHVKQHQATPALAHLQLRGGGIGVTCARLSEAERMVDSGVGSVLIAHQIVSPAKMARLAMLAKRAEVLVAVDDAGNAAALPRVARAHGASLGVLVEVDIGHHRCGVQPYGEALDLARAVAAAPGLRFMGLMGYDGHCTMKIKSDEREALSLKANRLLAETRFFVERAGLSVTIVSGSGTFTHRYAATVPGITEIQAGSYLLMDDGFVAHGVDGFETALSVLSTVTGRHSRAEQGELAIIDAGRKSMDILLGLPRVKSHPDARVVGLSAEHGRLALEGPARQLRVGDTVELGVQDAGATIGLFRKFHAVRAGAVEAVWDIPG